MVDALADGWAHEQTIDDVKKFSPDLLVIYTSLDSLENEIKLTKKLKREVGNAFIVFVGPWCATDPEGILKKASAVDGLIRREFDLPLANLADILGRRGDIGEVKELTWRRGDEIVSNPDGEFINSQQLEELPFVTDVYRRYLNLKNYRQTSLKYPFIDLFTARGCYWGKCTFCLWPFTIQRGACYRARSISNVIEELKFIKKELPEVKEIFFQDDALPPRRTKELAEAILKNNLNLVWSAYARTDIDYETLKLAKRAGCRILHVGYESGNDQILKNVKKGETVEKMEKFTKDAKRAGLKIHGDFIIGLPGETKETIKETIDFAKKINISDYQFVVPQPHPATPYHDYLEENNFLSEGGKPSYPEFSIEKLEYWRFRAYREIYFSPRYLLTRVLGAIKEPSEAVRLLRVARRGLPKIFSHISKRTMLKKVSLKLQRLRALPISIWKWFEDDEEFRKILQEVEGYTMLKPERLYYLYHFSRYASALSGEAAEVGVWKGGCLKMLTHNFNKQIYGFDLFDARENSQLYPEFDYQEVTDYFKNEKNIILIKGDINQTLSEVADKSFCFVHIDCDFPNLIFRSLEFFYRRLVKGGVIIIDDYGDVEWSETVKVVKDFLADKPEEVIPLTKQQGLIIKV